jgi:uncharacterized sulfatase
MLRKKISDKSFVSVPLILWLLSGSIFAMGPSLKHIEEPSARPNILVVMVDDQGYGQLDPFIVGGSTQEEAVDVFSEVFEGDPVELRKAAIRSMPTLRTLAGEGVRFSNATVPIPLCSPSRVGFITGAYPQRHGIYSNDDIVASGTDTRARFLSEDLQDHGYRTAIIGKWHMGEYRRERLKTESLDYHRWNRVSMREEDHPFNRGFDRYFGFTASGSNFYNPSSLFEGWDPVEEEEYLTDAFTREAIAFIDSRSHEVPFFLFLAYNAPHIPVYEPAPPEYREPFDTGNPAVDNYYAKLRALDEGIGKIKNHLIKRGEWENTFFVYFSDNGAVADSPHPRNAPLRGFKGHLHQGGIRIPMVWHLPVAEAVEPRLFEAPVSSMDILPTALRLAGIEVGCDLDGINLLPDLASESSLAEERMLFYAGSHAHHWGDQNMDFWNEYNRYLFAGDPEAEHPQSSMVESAGPGGLAVQHGDYCLVWDADFEGFRLFNLSGDISESRDVSGDEPERVAQLKSALREWLKDLPPPTDWNPAFWESMRKAVGLH